MLCCNLTTILTYLRIVSIVVDFILSTKEGTCAGRCGTSLDASRPCQCNSHCVNFGDCCPDYSTLCAGGSTSTGTGSTGTGSSGTCQSLSQISQEMWNNDVNRVPSSAYTVNYQARVPDPTNVDQASQKLFTNVDESYLRGQTYTTFMALMDNYFPTKGQSEHVTPEETQEEEAFLDAILSTSVMNSLLNYLTCRGIVSSQAELKSTLRRIWFDLYPRSGSSTTPDTNGFEHVLVGEYKSSTAVNGFHNWLSFYEKEKDGEIDYYGYVSRDLAGPLIGAAFEWNNRMKPLGSFLIGVSPEFDIAIYSLCFLTNPNSNCGVSMNSQAYSIMSYSKDGHIATAFVSA